MNAARAALLRAERRWIARLEAIEARLEAGEEAWTEYARAVALLAALAPVTAPGADGALLTTRQMAERLGIAPKTLLRRAKRGEVAPVRFGQRGRAAVRWPA